MFALRSGRGSRVALPHRMNISLVFADGSETFAPASVSATRPNLTRALAFIGRRHGGGGTRLLAALERALAVPRQPGASRTVVLLTDGRISPSA